MKSLAVLALLLSSLAAVCQQQPAAEKPAAPSAQSASREEVLRFVEVSHIREQMSTTLDSMAAVMKQQISSNLASMLKLHYPDVTEEEIRRFDPVIQKALTALDVDEMVNLLVPVYQKYFTHSDIEAAVGFYGTPAGQRVVVATRQASADAVQVGADYGRRKMEAQMPQLEKEIEAIVADIERTHGHDTHGGEQEFKPATPAPPKK